MKAHSFDITIRGEEYFIDIIEEGENTDVFIEKDDGEEWEDIPEDEMLMVVNYLVQEGFIKKPKFF